MLETLGMPDAVTLDAPETSTADTDHRCAIGSTTARTARRSRTGLRTAAMSASTTATASRAVDDRRQEQAVYARTDLPLRDRIAAADEAPMTPVPGH